MNRSASLNPKLTKKPTDLHYGPRLQSRNRANSANKPKRQTPVIFENGSESTDNFIKTMKRGKESYKSMLSSHELNIFNNENSVEPTPRTSQLLGGSKNSFDGKARVSLGQLPGESFGDDLEISHCGSHQVFADLQEQEQSAQRKYQAQLDNLSHARQLKNNERNQFILATISMSFLALFVILGCAVYLNEIMWKHHS